MVRSEHVCAQQTPIQPSHENGCKGRVEIFPEFEEKLRDLDGFSHLYLIYHRRQAECPPLMDKPFLQDLEHGVVSATRAPCCPNPVGLSVLELLRREGNVLHLDGVDTLDGKPLLDIKPYTDIRSTINLPQWLAG